MGIIFQILVVYFFLLVSCSANQNVPAFFTFGDSLVDVGNNNYLQTIAKGNYYPFGIDFGNNPTGRFTNGRTTFDILRKIRFDDIHTTSLCDFNSDKLVLQFIYVRYFCNNVEICTLLTSLLSHFVMTEQELGFANFTPPYLAPTTVGDVLLRGVNYASAGSGIFNSTGYTFVSFLPNLQVFGFKEVS